MCGPFGHQSCHQSCLYTFRGSKCREKGKRAYSLVYCMLSWPSPELLWVRHRDHRRAVEHYVHAAEAPGRAWGGPRTFVNSMWRRHWATKIVNRSSSIHLTKASGVKMQCARSLVNYMFSWPSPKLLGLPHAAHRRASEPHEHAPEVSGRATRACDLRGIGRTYNFHATCVREMCGGSSYEAFGSPMALPRAICGVSWPRRQFPPIAKSSTSVHSGGGNGRSYLPRLVIPQGGRRISFLIHDATMMRGKGGRGGGGQGGSGRAGRGAG